MRAVGTLGSVADRQLTLPVFTDEAKTNWSALWQRAGCRIGLHETKDHR